jgi:hypothetical protein
MNSQSSRVQDSMEQRLELFRDPREPTLPAVLVEPIRRRGGRPKVPVVLRVRTAEDVESLRSRNVPMFFLTPERISRAGYPMTFEPRLVVPRPMVSQVVTGLRVLPVKNPETVRGDRLEALVTLMLRVDRLASRALAVRNRSEVNGSELYRMVVNEGLEREATQVRLQDFAKDVPVVGPALPREDLDWAVRNNPRRGGPWVCLPRSFPWRVSSGAKVSSSWWSEVRPSFGGFLEPLGTSTSW